MEGPTSVSSQTLILRHGTEPVPPIELVVAQRSGCAIISTPSRRGCSSVVEHLLAKEDVASSSLVTRSLFHWQLSRRLISRAGDFFESKPAPGCISLQKDEYENIGSLQLLNCACGRGPGPGSTATAASSSDSSVPGTVGFRDGERVARLESGRQATSKAG